ncbi:MAG: hypothetical protein ACK4NY_02660 [Spirosomataceae bacterium]
MDWIGLGDFVGLGETLKSITMKEIKYNPNGLPVRVQVNMTGIVFITYRLFFFGAKVTEEKVLFTETGNNKQPHDDTFILIDPTNPTEPVSNTTDRILLLEVTVFGIQPNDTPFEVSMDFFQKNSNASPEVKIGMSDKIKGNKKLSNNPKTEFLVVTFKPLP